MIHEVVPRALDGQRLDRVVALVTGGSRAEAAALVDEGAVTVGGSPVTARSHRVAEGDVRSTSTSPDRPAEIELAADPTVPVPVVHEDADLLVVDKPAGLVVHPGAGQASGTLVNGLLARYPEIRDVGQPDRPGIVHRLDKGTSGLLVVAQLRGLRRAGGDARRPAGRPPLPHARVGTVASPTGLVDAPVGRSGRERTRMAVTVRGKPARTWYEVVRTFHQPVEVTELGAGSRPGAPTRSGCTWRRSAIGSSVTAATAATASRCPCPRPFLHAEQLGFEHPVTGEALAFTSPLPDDLAAGPRRPQLRGVGRQSRVSAVSTSGHSRSPCAMWAMSASVSSSRWRRMWWLTIAQMDSSTHWPSWSHAPFWWGSPKSPTAIGPSTATRCRRA